MRLTDKICAIDPGVLGVGARIICNDEIDFALRNDQWSQGNRFSSFAAINLYLDQYPGRWRWEVRQRKTYQQEVCDIDHLFSVTLEGVGISSPKRLVEGEIKVFGGAVDQLHKWIFLLVLGDDNGS